MNAPTIRNTKTPGSRLALLGFCLIVGIGAGLRLWDLEHRLFHGDEANQGIRTALILEKGEYVYDPVEFHGPTLYYFGAAVERVAGHTQRAEMTEWGLRIVPVFFGVVTIALVWGLRGVLGTPATLFAALLLSLSPALTFNSRFYIQETLLACFTLATIVFGLKLDRNPRVLWGLLTGIGIGLMHATKETALIAWISIVAAGVLTAVATWGVVRWKSEKPVSLTSGS